MVWFVVSARFLDPDILVPDVSGVAWGLPTWISVHESNGAHPTPTKLPSSQSPFWSFLVLYLFFFCCLLMAHRPRLAKNILRVTPHILALLDFQTFLPGYKLHIQTHHHWPGLVVDPASCTGSWSLAAGHWWWCRGALLVLLVWHTTFWSNILMKY